jgi:hypothetical protein
MHVQMHDRVAKRKTGATMGQVHDGISSRQLSGAAWRKSRYSGAHGNCVEIAPLRTGDVALRNSRFPEGPFLIYTREEMAAFLSGARDGEFDDVLVEAG